MQLCSITSKLLASPFVSAPLKDLGTEAAITSTKYVYLAVTSLSQFQ
jgi:hypothetical protein